MMSTTLARPLRLERTFDASPAELWSAWTDPRQYAKWFNPAPGLDLVIHEFDVRPGGRIRFDMPQPDGNRNPQEGVFHAVNPPTEIVSGAPDKSFLLKVSFQPVGARTRMIVEVTGVPPEYHAMATKGWNAGFDKLELALAKATAVRGQTWRMERLFDCTPEEMWAAWTDPAQLAKWISPFPGLDAEIHEFEARPGGRVRFTMIGPDGTRYPEASFLFEVLRPPHEIVQFEANRNRPDVFDGHPMRMRIRFEAVGQQTRIVFEQAGLPENFPVEAAKGGFGACFDKLAAQLARQKSGAE